VLACGGEALNSFESLSEASLGHAGTIYEHVIGEDKYCIIVSSLHCPTCVLMVCVCRYTFVEDVKHPESVTILLKGPNGFTLNQMKDAVRDGLRAVKNAIDDGVFACLTSHPFHHSSCSRRAGCVLPGAGAFELAVSEALVKLKPTVTGRARLGVQVPCAVQCFVDPHQSHLASPHLTLPHLTSPHLASPCLTSPHLTLPHLTSPCLTSPQAYADAMLIIPKVLAQNAGFDPQETMVKLQEAAQTTGMLTC
jgi:chaperonin GroEL (HSP60 family)